MEHIEVQGEQVPALGFGTWQLSGDEAREGTRHALEIGYRQIDTAQAYRNEREVGEGIAQSGVPREEVFLTTKIVGESLAGDKVGPAVDDSLRRLGTEYVDLLLIHWPTDEVPLGETLEAMVAAKDAGKVRHLGVSNFRGPLLLEAMEMAPILADQVPYQPGRTQNTLLGIAAERDVMITAYSPLRGDGLSSPVLAEIADAHGKTPQQIALRWLLQQDKVSPIPRSGNPEHRQQNVDVFDVELSDDEMARISAIRVEG
ncbi:aldo/keto reductase [Actinomarinicola tropica]|uniref:Aldo/keto reductase n=1 Tax=Actinomarinicola tropica TaxID=2789776 RepID=A0A5Q2RRP8_9ACTN|nr:aldo/keto reductase [Actinomarinicola tropica]QGG96570.1 aldo/keto reductase [Actinomarinicola tropica]